ncbi:hypothetical protein TNCV_400101 [Trichonephila clavipes]|nr:hypothetical protein TNCV_400101 [Trichonephila clavipes]
MVLITQHWSLRREYSQDKSGIGKLAWKLSDFIKRDGTVKIRRSSRENRSTRKRVRLKLRDHKTISTETGRTRIVTISQHTSMTVRDIVTEIGVGKFSISRIINQQKNFGAVSPKRKSKCGRKLSCIEEDAEEGLTPELDGKADISDVERSLLGIGFTGSDSDTAAIGDVDVKRSA